MKKDLIYLINQIHTIETKFKTVDSIPGFGAPFVYYIYDVPEFITWKEAVKYELQEIYNRTHDTYVFEIINATGVISKFNGKSHDEKRLFNSLKSSLYIIQKNIDKYYPNEESEDNYMSTPKIFLSHASADLKYVSPLVELLADIGLTNENLFCSSVPDYSIPLGEDIYDYLSMLFREHKLYVIFALSDNYYKSAACLNEMGAAWVLKNDYTSILLPGFSYAEIKGAVNPNKIGMKLDDDDEMLKKRLGDLKNIISKEFGISVPDMRWEKKRNDFVKAVQELSK